MVTNQLYRLTNNISEFKTSTTQRTQITVTIVSLHLDMGWENYPLAKVPSFILAKISSNYSVMKGKSSAETFLHK